MTEGFQGSQQPAAESVITGGIGANHVQMRSDPATMVMPQPGQQFPPLLPAMFQAAYTKWCAQHRLQNDEALLNYEGRSIDLYALHSAVMRSGGVQRVSIPMVLFSFVDPGVFSNILCYSRLHFQVNSSDHRRSARIHAITRKRKRTWSFGSSDGAAPGSGLREVPSQIRHGVHQGVIPEGLKNAQQQQQQQGSRQARHLMHNAPNPQMRQYANGIPDNMQGAMGPQPGSAQQSPLDFHPLANHTGVTDPARLNEFIQYSMIPSETLRAHGVDPAAINLIELHRPLF